jgi:hypothetical protein
MKNNVIGPFFFEEHAVTGDTSLVMMENTALLNVPVGTVFQSDDASSHFSHCVHAFLDREFPDHWIGRWGFITWLPSYSRLTPLFLFWGFVKEIVYCKKMQNMNELHDTTVRAAECITNEILANIW